MPLHLTGTDAAAEILAAAAERAASTTQRIGRAPVLAAVAIDTGDPAHLYFDVKQRAFDKAGAVFQPIILPPDATTASLSAQIRALNDDDGVDAIFIQYPLPPAIDAQAAYDEIVPAKDVDGASSILDSRVFMPATAEAVVQLLQHHSVTMRGKHVCIVRGDAVFADALAQLFRDAGARPVVAPLDHEALDEALGQADIIVAATGVIDGVRASLFRDGAAAVDVGYYHGGGRGDIAITPADKERLSAFATPRGSIGPLTVAILIDHTIRAAELLADARSA